MFPWLEDVNLETWDVNQNGFAAQQALSVPCTRFTFCPQHCNASLRWVGSTINQSSHCVKCTLPLWRAMHAPACQLGSTVFTLSSQQPVKSCSHCSPHQHSSRNFLNGNLLKFGGIWNIGIRTEKAVNFRKFIHISEALPAMHFVEDHKFWA